jgi:transposase
MSTSTRYPAEVRERTVRMVFEHEGEHGSQWAAISSIAAKLGMTPETLRKWEGETPILRHKRTTVSTGRPAPDL